MIEFYPAAYTHEVCLLDKLYQLPEKVYRSESGKRTIVFDLTL